MPSQITHGAASPSDEVPVERNTSAANRAKDFDAQGLHGHDCGRSCLRSLVHIGWKEGDLSAYYSCLAPAPVSHYLSLSLHLFEWLSDVRWLWEETVKSGG